MAARNRCLRIAALIAAAAYLAYTARDLITAQHALTGPSLAGGYIISSTLFPAVHLVEAGGWVVIATALGDEIDWQRLRLGGTIVATALIADYVAWVFYLLPTLDRVPSGDYRSTYIWTAIASLLLAVGAGIFVTGLAPARRGRARASRLWLGMIVVSASLAANTVGLLYQQSFYAGEHAAHAVTIGALVQAVGVFGLALAALVLALRIRRPLGGREAALAAAATGAAVAFLCVVGGEVLIAVYSSSHGVAQWQGAVLWIGLGYRIGLAAAVSCVAFGARRFAVANPSPPPDEVAVSPGM